MIIEVILTKGMIMTDYIERSINDAREIDLENTLNVDEFTDETILLDFLGKNYPYIRQAIESEEYMIEEYRCPFFRELVYDGKVVGFYTFEYVSDIIERLCINEFYVVPEYRKNKIFINTLKKLIAHSNYDSILLRNPPRLIIDILLEKGYDPKNGARPLRRIIQKELEDKAARKIVEGLLLSGDILKADAENGEIILTK